MATSNGAQPNGTNGGKKELKILMIHGYTQSGPLFHAKTKALEKFLIKALAPASITPSLIYPTAPNRLSPSDIPGFDKAAADGVEDLDMWAWFRKDDATNTYRFLNEGMNTIAKAISDAGGIDGVCGFSQGGATAALVAAALEPSREAPEGSSGDWARKLKEANGGRAARFAISYSGFYAPPNDLQWLYEPRIKTPTLHYIGSLDTVVDESRSQALVDRCEEPVLLVHPGGHFVPISKDWAVPLAGFIKNHAERTE